MRGVTRHEMFAESACNYIAKVGAIPRSWLKLYVQYDPMRDDVMFRVDCMEVVFSTRFSTFIEHPSVIDKLQAEMQQFIMLLWGETEVRT